MVAPILKGNLLSGITLKIGLWIVAILRALKLTETFLAVSN